MLWLLLAVLLLSVYKKITILKLNLRETETKAEEFKHQVTAEL